MTGGPRHGRSALALCALTGAAGLGSESAYLKLLDFSVGSAPLVGFVVVAVFLLGVGIGAHLSPMVRRPWKVEAALAAYNALWVVALSPLLAANALLLEALIPALGASLAPSALAVPYLLPPAILLGVTFPALVEVSGRPGLALLYQSIGALAGVPLVEAVLYPAIGLGGTLLFIAALHGVAAAVLFGAAPFRFVRTALGRPVADLAMAGVSTGAFQGVWLLLAALLFHPFYFIQPAVVAAMLLGLAIGAAVWSRWPQSFSRVVIAAAVGMTASIALAAVWTRLSPPRSLRGAIGPLIVLILPAAIPIGALFPAFVHSAATRQRAGAALLSLAAGNAVGVLLAGAVLLALLSPIAAAAVAVAPALLVAARSRRGRPVVVALAIGLTFIAATTSDRDLIDHAIDNHRVAELEIVIRGPGELTAVYLAEYDAANRAPERKLYQSGYVPVTLEPRSGLYQESVIGGIGIAYAEATPRALVLGVGSGRTAGYVASFAEHTDVVDIGATVPALLQHLRAESYGLLDDPSVTYHAMDALLAPHVLPKGEYDLIVHTLHPSYVSRAAKLYTREYLADLSTLLAPAGVLVTWSDTASLSPTGNQILINTLAAQFDGLRFLSVNEGGRADYYAIVCSNAPLTYRAERLRAAPSLRDDPATRSLTKGEDVRWFPQPRFHSTGTVHRYFRPSLDILLAGYPTFGNAPE